MVHIGESFGNQEVPPHVFGTRNYTAFIKYKANTNMNSRRKNKTQLTIYKNKNEQDSQ